ncbi:hypothetical protein F3157_22575 [Virgibacillus dakarensis]|nr:hypothetical protein [Virgibacillus dakarensis]
MAQVAQNHVTGGSEIWQRWYYLMSLCTKPFKPSFIIPLNRNLHKGYIIKETSLHVTIHTKGGNV